MGPQLELGSQLTTRVSWTLQVSFWWVEITRTKTWIKRELKRAPTTDLYLILRGNVFLSGMSAFQTFAFKTLINLERSLMAESLHAEIRA